MFQLSVIPACTAGIQIAGMPQTRRPWSLGSGGPCRNDGVFDFCLRILLIRKDFNHGRHGTHGNKALFFCVFRVFRVFRGSGSFG